ncbi:MAG: DUF1566 domain-containing protein [Proteobacteria bacterium]|nr:DUF1566 domain-containing protein [Pseudomonadota bacterium]
MTEPTGPGPEATRAPQAGPSWRLLALWCCVAAGGLAACGGGSGGSSPAPTPAPTPTPAPAPAPSLAPEFKPTFSRINDTGIQWCIDDVTGYWWQRGLCSPTPANATWVAAEDGRLGRDFVYSSASGYPFTRIGVGVAGFDFSPLNATGQASATSGAACARDNVTGLTWEVRNTTNPQDLRYYRHVYSWYSSDDLTNGGNPGSNAAPLEWDTGTVLDGTAACAGLPAGTACTTQNYVAAVNAAMLCGASDWRLPSREELATIAHLGVYETDVTQARQARIFQELFPDVSIVGTGRFGPRARTWTASTRADLPENAWTIDFATGGSGSGVINYEGKDDPEAVGDGSGPKTHGASVRLVRGGL